MRHTCDLIDEVLEISRWVSAPKIWDKKANAQTIGYEIGRIQNIDMPLNGAVNPADRPCTIASRPIVGNVAATRLLHRRCTAARRRAAGYARSTPALDRHYQQIYMSIAP
ncbi:hypothetical protein HBH56_034620 [Parastagonospora nodorum]|uniref:Uncharacterized protein n=1 Tax=Phaeosphaeria nodorum (strain SN15 / ATCC MYA-4574 / FGSC 10173) TaxID=321614 RepID=A0A7U2F7F5_PHANO|nr:hypothetical protein HBH56_034620 [Parastagonospora nodorum]QRD00151.1 hypothetical protein JI435_438020 [Parastagonospora nodorum SN15]KAH3934035.1 hypothetical protein HBH54_064830 [Parastagonospora nodorum]KAH4143190.1 hypothetical protein HBH45_045800 [Parastagonospora nodorum]KAH4174895.1 hypothetical protein HBH44_002860 [Parastagonospora nodorum]